eukprot:4148264-Amphidinium_carterae.1
MTQDAFEAAEKIRAEGQEVARTHPVSHARASTQSAFASKVGPQPTVAIWFLGVRPSVHLRLVVNARARACQHERYLQPFAPCWWTCASAKARTGWFLTSLPRLMHQDKPPRVQSEGNQGGTTKNCRAAALVAGGRLAVSSAS